MSANSFVKNLCPIPVIANPLFWHSFQTCFVIIIRFNQSAVHDQNVEYISIITVFHNSSVIKNRKICSIFFCKMESDIIILSTGLCINLFPDAGLNRIPFVWMDQVSESMICVIKKIIKIPAASKFYQFTICK